MRARIVFCCLTAVLLSACAPAPVKPPPVVCPPPPPPPPPPVVIPDNAAPINDLLAFQAGLRQLASADLIKVLTDMNTKPSSGDVLIRRAMLLTALHNNGDLGRAQALLDTVSLSEADDEKPLRPLARALSGAVADRRAQDESIDRLNTQIRESQRQNAQLNDKLEALKNIERTLSARPATPPPAAPVPAGNPPAK